MRQLDQLCGFGHSVPQYAEEHNTEVHGLGAQCDIYRCRQEDIALAVRNRLNAMHVGERIGS
jgi:hypothetical protein